MGCAETQEMRKKRILNKYPPVLTGCIISWIISSSASFRNSGSHAGLFILTRGENRVMTRAEILGRLYSCGFVIQEEGQVNGKYFFVVDK